MCTGLAVCLALLQAPCMYYVIHPPTTLEGLLPHWTDEEKEARSSIVIGRRPQSWKVVHRGSKPGSQTPAARLTTTVISCLGQAKDCICSIW